MTNPTIQQAPAEDPGKMGPSDMTIANPPMAIVSVLAVLYASAYFLGERLLQLFFVPAAALDKALRWTRLFQRLPLLWLPVASIAAAFGAISGLPMAFERGLLAGGLACILWSLVIVAACVAHAGATTPGTSIADIEQRATQRWPEKWYARHLAKPIDAHYVRALIANSLMIVPAVIALLWPAGPTIPAVLLYAVALLSISRSQEELDHCDIHNNLFSSSHLAPGFAKVGVWLTSQYLRVVLNPLCSRIPHFYRIHHVYMHHVENNGAEDLQTTMHADRTSFHDFCVHALKLAVSNSFGVDLYSYLVRKRRYREVRQLLAGMVGWFAALALIAAYSPVGAAVVLIVHFLGAVPGAINTYIWHGFVDPDDPENVYLNTVNSVVNPDVLLVGSLHLRHHIKGGEHWTKQAAMTPAESDACLQKSVVLLSPLPGNALLSALWRDRMDIIATRVRPLPGQASSDMVDMLRRRTRPKVAAPSSNLTRWIDRSIGKLFANHLLMGAKV